MKHPVSESFLRLDMQRQPDDTTCGPTCLHAVYRYFDDHLPLHTVIDNVEALESGGTLAVYLALDAIRRGYTAMIHTCNLQIFDPIWFRPNAPDMRHRLALRAEWFERDETLDLKMARACRGYIEYLDAGGRLSMDDLTPSLIAEYLERDLPLLVGLSSTWLYRAVRDFGPTDADDDVRGMPGGHFVVLVGYDPATRCVSVADPTLPNPIGPDHIYDVTIDRLVCAILLGIVTYDANLLVLEPSSHGDPES